MSLKPTHVGVTVRDMDQGIRWYSENLGFTLLRRDTYAFMHNMEIAFLALDDFQLELFCAPEPKPAPEGIYSDNAVVGIKHLAFQTDDLESLLRHMTAAGVEILFRTEMEGDKVCFVKDCCGTPVELIQRG